MSCLLSDGKIIKNPTKRQIICLYAWLNHNLLTINTFQTSVNGVAKGGLLHAKRRPFTRQKTAFCNAKDRRLENGWIRYAVILKSDVVESAFYQPRLTHVPQFIRKPVGQRSRGVRTA